MPKRRLPYRKVAFFCNFFHLFMIFYPIPYAFILLYSVVRPMPSSSAASLRLPFACSNTRMICFLSISSNAGEASVVDVVSSKSNASGVTVSPSVNSTAERTIPFSSLTFPVHVWASISFLASASKPFTCLSNSLLARFRKKIANGIMSSRHLRSGGRTSVYSFSR